ncbi:SAV_2336 N-terminal domain-related protein [Streptomyces sp. NPDC002688]|uniref:SAV_2336 N-terminal domain-related protein n=1 Tax=Streptomyces sp. NPDC002688 TaxID=3154423 RepID=UPI00332E9902
MTHPFERTWHITAAPADVLVGDHHQTNSVKAVFNQPPSTWPCLPPYGAEACADALDRLRAHPPSGQAQVHNSFELPGEPGQPPNGTNGNTPTRELILLVDTGSSMPAWYSTIDGLRACAMALESFIEVRIRKLDPPVPDEPELNPAAWQDLDLHLPAHPHHRKIVFVVTDGVGALWRRGLLWDELQLWAQHHTVAILNVLAHGSWRRSALSTRACQLKAPEPVCANSELVEVHTQDPASADRSTGPASTASSSPAVLPIPVLELHREWLGKWVHLMTSTLPVQQHVLELGNQQLPPLIHKPAAGADDAATRMVASFRTASLPSAFELAVTLAATPLNRHVMQTIAAEMLPWSTPHDLSAILTSGLLINRDSELIQRDPFDEAVFDFSPGVRQTLLAQGDVSKTLEVVRLLDQHLGPHVNAIKGITERLHNPSAARFPDITDETLPYLRIERDVLATFAMTADSPHRQASENLSNRIGAYEACHLSVSPG